jgi:hypothetical protein
MPARVNRRRALKAAKPGVLICGARMDGSGNVIWSILGVYGQIFYLYRDDGAHGMIAPGCAESNTKITESIA